MGPEMPEVSTVAPTPTGPAPPSRSRPRRSGGRGKDRKSKHGEDGGKGEKRNEPRQPAERAAGEASSSQGDRPRPGILQLPHPLDGGERKEPRQRRPASRDGAGGRSRQSRSTVSSKLDASIPLHQRFQGEGGAPDCIVCFERAWAVTLGGCNHAVTCADCSLKARLCYRQRACPLCKQELETVVLTEISDGRPVDFEALTSTEPRPLDPRYGPGILVDKAAFGGHAERDTLSPFHRAVAQLTSPGCGACGAALDTPSGLLSHVKRRHSPRRICPLCLSAGREFTRLLEFYDDEDRLAEHMKNGHPRCEFCRRSFYDADELWAHMRDTHVTCHVCPSSLGPQPDYFRNIAALREHVLKSHHYCDASPECARQLIAFNTLEELQRHVTERHRGSSMPRWDAGRARPLDVFESGSQERESSNGNNFFLGGPAHRQTSVSSSRRRQDRDRRLQRDRSNQGNTASLHEDDDAGHRGFAMEFEHGLRVQDDDRSVTRNSTAARPAFPSLSETVPAQPPHSNDPAAVSSQQRRPPPLVKKTVKCPCGRRVSHYALEEGQEAPPLRCDAECALAARRSTLAEAFGVSEPGRGPVAFGPGGSAEQLSARPPPAYPLSLLAAARSSPGFIRQLEAALGDFVCGSSQPARRALWPMNRAQRGTAHALAAEYGVVSVGQGQEPHRTVQLHRTPGCQIPSRLLSKVAASITDQQLEEMAAAETQHIVRFTDVAMSVDLHYYLRRWDGSYKLNWETADTAVARFASPKEQQEVLDTFGGGVRGQFRLDRSALAAERQQGRQRGWEAGRGELQNDSQQATTWSSMATSAPPIAAVPLPRTTIPGAGDMDGRWAVMKRPVRAAAAVTESNRSLAANPGTQRMENLRLLSQLNQDA